MKKKIIIFFASLIQVTEKKESDPGLEPDPDPLVRGTDPDLHPNVTDPQHCLQIKKEKWSRFPGGYGTYRKLRVNGLK
jgi:hypothetical protein